ncbi:MAG TPA: 50S ribosomal protein L30 [Legionellales bacterium]|jgi:large subunit ribosomal protein L30|nr:50S ribosomal protein L30 [Legionellales bacterium]
MSGKLQIKLVKSLSGRKPEHKVIASVLGLKRMNQVVEHNDIPSIRGMVNKINYLLHVEELA